MHLTATHINYYHVCHRKLWLFSNGINMEHNSDLVAEGKLIGNESYPERAGKYTEVEIDGIKIDFYDARNKVVHEIKKSNSVEQAHIAQVKYYIYKLQQKGLTGVTGLLEYPTLRQREVVELSEQDIIQIQKWESEIEQITKADSCPEVINSKICKRCSYFEFCYVQE